MTAIETEYAGCRFRSRLEARWAIVFDHLGYEWQYEPEGFEREHYDKTLRYLPDFYLPEFGTWVEVKGSYEHLSADAEKLAWMCDWGSPLPGVDQSHATTRGLLVLGEIPKPADALPGFLLIQHSKGLWFNRATLMQHSLLVWDGIARTDYRSPYGDASWSNDLSQMDPDMDCPPILLWADGVIAEATDPQTRWDHAMHAGRTARFEYGETPVRGGSH